MIWVIRNWSVFYIYQTCSALIKPAVRAAGSCKG
jgi:hypothetical protein